MGTQKTVTIYLFGHLVFYLFGPQDSVYWTSSVWNAYLNLQNFDSSENQSCNSPEFSIPVGYSDAIWIMDRYSDIMLNTKPKIMALFDDVMSQSELTR